MSMVGVVLSKRCRFILLATLALGLTALTSQEAQASGGSWGSSRGGFASSGGSGGSLGGGLLSGRQPVRNLLSGIGSRLGGGSWGSRGGSSGGSIGGRSWGSSGGWTGSNGSNGGWGSTGSTSFGSSGGYASSSTGAAYGSWGSSYLNSYASTSPIETSYATSGNAYTMGGYSLDQSYPVGDYGFDSSYPMSGTLDQGFIGSAPMGGPIMDGGSIDSMLNSGIPFEGGEISPIQAAPGYYESAPSETEGGASGDAGGQVVEPPGPAEDDGTSIGRPNTDSSVLNLVLPEEAQVYINGKLTKTKGALRSYVSRKLTNDRDYKYQVKAVLVLDGKQQVRTQLVKMRAGLDETVRFNFDEPVITTLALKVPENAKVKLCGNETTASGENRTFATKSLTDGKVWKDYTVTVEFERDGETHTEQRSLDMVAGETYTLAIGIESNDGRIASR